MTKIKINATFLSQTIKENEISSLLFGHIGFLICIQRVYKLRRVLLLNRHLCVFLYIVL